MALERERPARPVAVGRINVTFTQDPDGEIQGTVDAALLDANGREVRHPSRELWSQMTNAQRTSLTTFLGNLRGRVEAEVLPDPAAPEPPPPVASVLPPPPPADPVPGPEPRAD